MWNTINCPHCHANHKSSKWLCECDTNWAGCKTHFSIGLQCRAKVRLKREAEDNSNAPEPRCCGELGEPIGKRKLSGKRRCFPNRRSSLSQKKPETVKRTVRKTTVPKPVVQNTLQIFLARLLAVVETSLSKICLLDHTN